MSKMIEIDFRPDDRTLRQFGWIALVGFGFVAAIAWHEVVVERDRQQTVIVVVKARFEPWLDALDLRAGSGRSPPRQRTNQPRKSRLLAQPSMFDPAERNRGPLCLFRLFPFALGRRLLDLRAVVPAEPEGQHQRNKTDQPCDDADTEAHRLPQGAACEKFGNP